MPPDARELGKFFGLGVGPGDPELISLKALKVLQRVQVVCAPKGRLEGGSLALRIASPFLTPEQVTLEVVMPMTREPAAQNSAWLAAARLVSGQLVQGRDVAFLTLGDPSLYSTYGYLLARLRCLHPELRVETIPGIPSFCAAAARLNLPLAEGDEPLAILPTLADAQMLGRVLDGFANTVCLKVSSNLPLLLRQLSERNLTASASYVARCGQEGEQVLPELDGLAGLQQPDYLSLIIVKNNRHQEDAGELQPEAGGTPAGQAGNSAAGQPRGSRCLAPAKG